ncbi:MAG: hypothetical protein AAB855_01035 [Patescibacteria group bacterium]
MRNFILIGLSFLVILTGLFFYYFMYGIPIHDIRMWRLERNYAYAQHPHSVVLTNVTYLGGPATHGSWRCNYVVGEVRSSQFAKEEILAAYNGRFVTPAFGTVLVPLKVLFFQDQAWPPYLPWFQWESELKKFSEAPGTPYLVYVAHENVPFLGDLRCDD